MKNIIRFFKELSSIISKLSVNSSTRSLSAVDKFSNAERPYSPKASPSALDASEEESEVDCSEELETDRLLGFFAFLFEVFEGFEPSLFFVVAFLGDFAIIQGDSH